MRLAADGPPTAAIAKVIGKHVVECRKMHKLLLSHAALPGKAVVIIENGLRITRCLPAFAGGIWPDRNVGSTGRR